MLHAQLMVNPADLNRLVAASNNLAPDLVKGAALHASRADRAAFLQAAGAKNPQIARLLLALNKG